MIIHQPPHRKARKTEKYPSTPSTHLQVSKNPPYGAQYQAHFARLSREIGQPHARVYAALGKSVATMCVTVSTAVTLCTFRDTVLMIEQDQSDQDGADDK